jgi:hypothetical protein
MNLWLNDLKVDYQFTTLSQSKVSEVYIIMEILHLTNFYKHLTSIYSIVSQEKKRTA